MPFRTAPVRTRGKVLGTPLDLRTVSFVNARVATPAGIADSMRFRSRILSVGERPSPGDTIVDLEGAFVLPGLVNAHDHLELNHYGRVKCHDSYANPGIRAGRSHPLSARLFIGGLKNLLSGVTTVAHHNPYYREIGRAFPVRVVRRYGWAHSFRLEKRPVGARGEPGGDIARRFRATPADAPFMIHLGEGIDDEARGELHRLDRLGCLRSNTVIVHGVGIEADGWRRVGAAGAALVWCPASNAFLLRRTADVRTCLDGDAEQPRIRVALATDSRLSGTRDLLEEMRVAACLAPVTAGELLEMVTAVPADILKLPSAGRLQPGADADFIVLPRARGDAAETLLAASRRDISLVAIGGRPLTAAAAFREMFSTRDCSLRTIRVDGVERLADGHLAQAIARCPIPEPGVECA